MHIALRPRWWLGAMLVLGAAATAATGGPAAARDRLAAERAAIEANFERESAACRERFVVTACIDAARERRRAALVPVQQRSQQIEAGERERRERERRTQIDRKQTQAAERQASPASAASSTPRPPLVARPAPRRPAAAPASAVARTDDAARKRADYQQRAAAAAAHRQDTERRNAARALEHPRAAPLPAWASSAASR